MRVTAMLIVIGGLTVAVLPARADDAAPKHDPRVAFSETDINQDGVVDHAEFQMRITEVFFSADRNKDGFLDPLELKQLAFPDDFTADDKDRDGRVSMREFLRVRFHDYEVADVEPVPDEATDQRASEARPDDRSGTSARRGGDPGTRRRAEDGSEDGFRVALVGLRHGGAGRHHGREGQ